MRGDTLKQIENWALYILVFLFPIIVLSSFPNPFVTPKLILLTFFLVVIFLLKVIRALSSPNRGLIFHTSMFDVPVVLLVVGYLASSFLISPNRMESFWLPGTASFIVGGALLYFVVNQLNDVAKKAVSLSLVASATVVSFVSVLSGSSILKAFTSLPAYVRSESFSTLGSTVATAMFILAILPIALQFVFKNSSMAVKAISGIASSLIGIALVITIVTLAKNWSATSLPGLTTSWIVATESLKGQPLLGMGPGNYLSAFTRFIPLSYNQTPKWSLRFSNGQNFYLTAITETGLIGFAALIVLLFVAYKRTRSSIKETNLFEHLPLPLLLIFFAVFPSTPVLILLMFILLGLETKAHVVHLFAASDGASEKLEGRIASVLVSIPTVAVALFLGFLVVQASRGELIYQKALRAVSIQDGKSAYDTIRGAIQISPYSDRYHITYAQLNLALANAVAQKKDITDEDKNTISQLVQQAIREGRAAVLLNNQRAGNWEVLASIYKSVIPLAKGADQFAIQTYSQTVALDPVNPNTRVALGGIYYSLKRYEEAIDVFKLAVVAKPDLPNSHYNLAIAYRDNGQYDKSLTELQSALTLVAKDGKDYTVLKKEIENVQSRYPKKNTTAQTTDNLTPPEKLEESKLEPKVELPVDATPPSPSPSPTTNQ